MFEGLNLKRANLNIKKAFNLAIWEHPYVAKVMDSNPLTVSLSPNCVLDIDRVGSNTCLACDSDLTHLLLLKKKN